jgi:hypothetical protein
MPDQMDRETAIRILMEATLARIETRSRRVCERAPANGSGARGHGGPAGERSCRVEALEVARVSRRKQVSNRSGHTTHHLDQYVSRAHSMLLLLTL